MATVDTADLKFLYRDMLRIRGKTMDKGKPFIRKEGDKLKRRAAKRASTSSRSNCSSSVSSTLTRWNSAAVSVRGT